MTNNRLEAFTDGVFAIIITIMVLELKAPKTTEWNEIQHVFPTLMGYLMSFLFVGVYWGNHHHLLHVAKHFSSGIMLTNLNLLFWLSLVPFATEWIGETHFAPLSVAVYAVLLNFCGISYFILQKAIESCNKHNEKIMFLLKRQKGKAFISIALYLVAVPLAYVNSYISVGIFFLVAIMWLVPDRRIERMME